MTMARLGDSSSPAFSATVGVFTINLGLFLGMRPEEEIWPVVLIAGSIVAV